MKVFLETFGCRANQYDSERVKSMVAAGGGEIVTAVEEADVAVYNSCAVTAEAEADLRQKVRRGARRNARVRSVIMGCASGLELGGSRRPDDAAAWLSDLPSVEALVRGADLDALAGAIGIRAGASSFAQSGARGLLRIQDGCDEHCTFCATTLARGANRSRGLDRLVDEAAALGEAHNEIVLTGIHIGSYGADTGSNLSRLVETLISRVPGVRFRLSSLEATEVDERLLAIFRSGRDRLAPYLHAPLQSGSDRILKRMGRHWYTAGEYARAIERVVDGHEFFGLGADVISGFPGETDSDHSATVALVESLPFTSLHVFPYSARPGTAAPRLGGAVSPPVIARRTRELRAIAVRKSDDYRSRRAGSDADVVVIRAAAETTKTLGQGLTGDYLAVALRDGTLRRGERFSALLDLEGSTMVATRLAG